MKEYKNQIRIHNLTRKQDVSIVNALMATTAAPTYFYSYSLNKKVFYDGGILANDPSLEAIHHCMNSDMKIDPKNIHVLSLDTGVYNNSDSNETGDFYGKLYWTQNFHELTMSANEKSNKDKAISLVGVNNYHRYQCVLTRPIHLDDHQSLKYLEEEADQYIEELYANDSFNKLLELLAF